MASARYFDKILCSALNDAAPRYKWETDWSADGERWKVDVAGLEGEIPRVIVEVEIKKDNPVENLVKIWRWATDEKKTGRMCFIQAFSAHFWKGRVKRGAKVRQRVRAEFIGDRMMHDRGLRIRYKELRIKKYVPGHGRGGGAMIDAAKRLARQIERNLP